jgi:hypothetical protein
MGKPVFFRDRIADRASYTVLDGPAQQQQDPDPAPAGQILQMNLLMKKKKKKPEGRLWMRLQSDGASELLELDRSTLTKLVSIPARDLRILGPVFSQSSSILGNSFCPCSLLLPFRLFCIRREFAATQAYVHVCMYV